MDDKTKKKFIMLAAAGLIVSRGVPAIATQTDVASDIDAALQQVRSEQSLSVDDIDALSAFDGGADNVALY
jgi:hypothetical protein